MNRFTYVYILQSESDPDHFYIGRTKDLRARVIRHNAGAVRQHIKMETMATEDVCGAVKPKRRSRLGALPEIGFGPNVRQKATLSFRNFISKNTVRLAGRVTREGSNPATAGSFSRASRSEDNPLGSRISQENQRVTRAVWGECGRTLLFSARPEVVVRRRFRRYGLSDFGLDGYWRNVPCAGRTRAALARFASSRVAPRARLSGCRCVFA